MQQATAVEAETTAVEVRCLRKVEVILLKEPGCRAESEGMLLKVWAPGKIRCG